MIRRFLLWLTARLPVKEIGRDSPDSDGQAYVEWYYVATLPIFGGIRVQLHRFRRSDPDGLHDHPWGWARTFILAGDYLEVRRDRDRLRSAGSTYGMTGDTFHRVVLPPDAPECWTLFIHGPYVKHWGFITPIEPTVVGYGHRLAQEPSWRSRRGGAWRYDARPRNRERFDDWHKTAPKGREIRGPA